MIRYYCYFYTSLCLYCMFAILFKMMILICTFLLAAVTNVPFVSYCIFQHNVLRKALIHLYFKSSGELLMWPHFTQTSLPPPQQQNFLMDLCLPTSSPTDERSSVCELDSHQRQGASIGCGGCCCVSLRLAPPAQPRCILVRLQDAGATEAGAEATPTLEGGVVGADAPAVLSVMEGRLQRGDGAQHWAFLREIQGEPSRIPSLSSQCRQDGFYRRRKNLLAVCKNSRKFCGSESWDTLRREPWETEGF